MNKYGKFFVGIAVLCVIVFLLLSKINSIDYVLADNGISPMPSSFTIETPIFYMNSEAMLESEMKTLLIHGDNIIKAVVDELKKPPIKPGHIKVIDDKLKVISYEIINQKLYLNLSKDLVSSEYWVDEYKMAILYSIVNSLTQFDTIDRIQIKVDGKDISAYFNDDNLMTDLTFNSVMNFQKPATAEEFIITFLNFIKIERYDLAYEMTTQSNSGLFKEKFTEAMIRYKSKKNRYSISQCFSKKSNGELSVIVSYLYKDSMRNIMYDGGSEEWQLIELPEGDYKVVWPRKK